MGIFPNFRDEHKTYLKTPPWKGGWEPLGFPNHHQLTHRFVSTRSESAKPFIQADEDSDCDRVGEPLATSGMHDIWYEGFLKMVGFPNNHGFSY